MDESRKDVGNGPVPNNDLTEKPKYDDSLPSALGQLAADVAGAWEGADARRPTPTPAKRRHLALLLDELLSLVEGDADLQQIFTRLPFALDKGLILQSFFTRVFPPPPELPAEPTATPIRLTDRERQVLQRMADGVLDNNMIARGMEISSETVHTHRKSIHRKLNVTDELEAVVKGVRLGLVQFDAIAFVTNIMRKKFTYSERSPLFDACMLGRYMKPDAQGETDRRMRLLHLLSVALLIASYLSLSASGDPSYTESAAGAVCELSAEGLVVHCFDGEGALRNPYAIAVAPPQASQQGFAPGNLFVSDLNTNPDLFNADRIVELTPDGKFVRALTGGSTFGTRLVAAIYLTFGADGSLFSSSGAPTDSVLRFTAGGAQVQRFGVPISPPGIAVAPNGDVYAVSFSSTRGHGVYVFDRNGETLRKWRFPAGVDPRGCALDADGNLLIGDLSNARLLKFSPTGKRLASFPCEGLSRYFALAPDGKLYITDWRAQDLKVFNDEGKLLKTLKVDPLQELRGVTVGEDGRMWVCGRMTEGVKG